MEFHPFSSNMDQNNNLTAFPVDDTFYETKLTTKFKKRKIYQPPNPDKLNAFIPGIVTKIHVKEGQTIKRGDSLLILEAMKMKNNVVSARDGRIKSISVKESQMVRKGELLLEYE